MKDKEGGSVMANLGEKIYELRQKHQMSQGDLADVLNVSRQSISKWENNSAVPELSKLVQMCDVFHVSLDELVRGINTNTVEKSYSYSSEDKITDPWEEKWLGIRKKNWLSFLGGLLAIKLLSHGGRYLFDGIQRIIDDIFYRAQRIYGTNGIAFAFKQYNKWFLVILILSIVIIVVSLMLLKVMIRENDTKSKIDKGIYYIGWCLMLSGVIGLIENVFIIISLFGAYQLVPLYIVKPAVRFLCGLAIIIWRKHKLSF